MTAVIARLEFYYYTPALSGSAALWALSLGQLLDRPGQVPDNIQSASGVAPSGPGNRGVETPKVPWAGRNPPDARSELRKASLCQRSIRPSLLL